MKADVRKDSGSGKTNGKGATLKQIAELAGCSTAVASTVLNNSRGNTVVSEQTRRRVLDIAREQDYRPNLSAQSMKSRKSRIIGALVRNNSRLKPDETHSHPLAWELVLGINEGLEAFGYMMSLVRLSDVDPEQHFQSSAFQGHLLDGLIVVNEVPAASEKRLKALVPHCVWLDTNVWAGGNCIRRDEEHAGKTVANELADLGYKKLLCVGHHVDGDGPVHYSFAQRMAGLQQVAQERDLSLETFSLSWDYGGLGADIDKLVRVLRRDVAIVAMDIYVAQILATWLVLRGVRPGLDFPLACCDDHFAGGGMEWNQLSRVTFNRFGMGQQAAHMMTQLLDNSLTICPSLLIQGEWIEGETALPLT
jgi:DNA-binding LacI/PurR family transcriptional regulator